jgi:hypothetical protein
MRPDKTFSTDLRKRLQTDLAKVINSAALRRLRGFLERQRKPEIIHLFAPEALNKISRENVAGAVHDYCSDVCRVYRDIQKIRVQLDEDEPDKGTLRKLDNEATKVGRQLKAAITQLEQIQPQIHSAALIAYYGQDASWPEPVTGQQLEAAKDVLRRAITWNELWIRRSIGSPLLPETNKGGPGRPVDDILRDCEAVLTSLLSTTGLRQRQVAQYTFDFMMAAGLEPKSWRSIEQRLLRRRRYRD